MNKIDEIVRIKIEIGIIQELRDKGLITEDIKREAIYKIKQNREVAFV